MDLPLPALGSTRQHVGCVDERSYEFARSVRAASGTYKQQNSAGGSGGEGSSRVTRPWENLRTQGRGAH